MKAQIIITAGGPLQVVLIPEHGIETKMLSEFQGKTFQAHIGHNYTLRQGNFLMQSGFDRQIALTEIQDKTEES